MANKLEYLFEVFLSKTITDEERLELADYLLKAENDESINILMEKAWQNVVEEQNMEEEKAESMLLSILGEKPKDVEMRSKGKLIRLWKRVSVAAAVLLLIGIGGYYYYFANKPEQQHDNAKSLIADVDAPVVTRAVLTLADGKRIFLDSIGSRAIELHEGIAVRRSADGQLVYEYSGISKNDVTHFNTLSNPKGSKVVDLLLSDGSKIWLNAGSSIEYPVAFSGTTRNVEVNGEVYFEVAANKSRPFIVRVNNSEIQVLGTHFNVMSYDDEETVQTTLLEGSVKFSNNHSSTILLPGQQSQLTKRGELKRVDQVNESEVLAWKNGIFSFEAARLETIMRQLSRWYDVEIKYDKRTDDLFYLEMPRTVSLSNILKVLELSADIRFEIDGNKITVKGQGE